jgi:hypothetical protein
MNNENTFFSKKKTVLMTSAPKQTSVKDLSIFQLLLIFSYQNIFLFQEDIEKKILTLEDQTNYVSFGRVVSEFSRQQYQIYILPNIKFCLFFLQQIYNCSKAIDLKKKKT